MNWFKNFFRGQRDEANAVDLQNTIHLVLGDGLAELWFKEPTQTELEAYIYGKIPDKYFWDKYLVKWENIILDTGKYIKHSNFDICYQIMRNQQVIDYILQAATMGDHKQRLGWLIKSIEPCKTLNELYIKRQVVNTSERKEITGKPLARKWKSFSAKVEGVSGVLPSGKDRGENIYGVRNGDPLLLIHDIYNSRRSSNISVCRFTQSFSPDDELGYLGSQVAKHVLELSKGGYHLCSHLMKHRTEYSSRGHGHFQCTIGVDVYIPNEPTLEFELIHRLGLKPAIAHNIVNYGVNKLFDFMSLSEKELMKIPGIGPKTAKVIFQSMQRLDDT